MPNFSPLNFNADNPFSPIGFQQLDHPFYGLPHTPHHILRRNIAPGDADYTEREYLALKEGVTDLDRATEVRVTISRTAESMAKAKGFNTSDAVDNFASVLLREELLSNPEPYELSPLLINSRNFATFFEADTWVKRANAARIKENEFVKQAILHYLSSAESFVPFEEVRKHLGLQSERVHFLLAQLLNKNLAMMRGKLYASEWQLTEDGANVVFAEVDDAPAVKQFSSPGTGTMQDGKDAEVPIAPTCFMSYSWDNESHKTWVRTLAANLRTRGGIDVKLDEWHVRYGTDIPAFIETSIRESDYVLMICTPEYARKSDSSKGGVGYEKQIITGSIFEGSAKPEKFTPVLRSGSQHNAIPTFLKGKAYADFTDESKYKESLDKLIFHLWGDQEHPPPEVGSRQQISTSRINSQTESTVDDINPAPSELQNLDLDQEEKDLLSSALRNQGIIEMHDLAEVKFYRGQSGEEFTGMEYEAAFDYLVDQDILRHESGILFKLTKLGIKIARHFDQFLDSGSPEPIGDPEIEELQAEDIDLLRLAFENDYEILFVPAGDHYVIKGRPGDRFSDKDHEIAFRELLDQGYFRHQSGRVHQLTRKGISLAKKLFKENPPSS